MTVVLPGGSDCHGSVLPNGNASKGGSVSCFRGSVVSPHMFWYKDGIRDSVSYLTWMQDLILESHFVIELLLRMMVWEKKY